MSASRRVLLLALLAALVAGCGPERGVRVVLITFDTLRYDAYAEGGLMPRTRERLAEGLEFVRSYSATSTTQPTHATLFTGLHPWEHGVVRNRYPLDDGLVTVAEILREEGFETGAVVASFPLARRFGFDQGFDLYDDRFSETLFRHGWAGHEVPKGKFYSLADDVVERASEVLDTLTGPKQFLWFHFFDAHDPYGDTGDGDRSGPMQILQAVHRESRPVDDAVAEARKLYAEDVAFLDRAVARLLRRLEEERDRYETHLVVTADHGEALGEGGSVGHGKRLIPAQIHVPLVILSPAVAPGTEEAVVGSIDLAPTLLSLAGTGPEVVEAVSAGGGRDLTVGRLGSRAAGMRRTFAAKAVEVRLDGSRHPLGDPLFYVIGSDGRIVRGNRGGVGTGSRGEGAAVADPLPADEMERLRGVFAGFEERLSATESGGTVDTETIRALRALGYVD